MRIESRFRKKESCLFPYDFFPDIRSVSLDCLARLHLAEDEGPEDPVLLVPHLLPPASRGCSGASWQAVAQAMCLRLSSSSMVVMMALPSSRMFSRSLSE